VPEKELIVLLSELTCVEFVCRREGCIGSITLDLNRTSQPSSKCPVCQDPLVVGMYVLAEAWQRFYKMAAEAKIQFRIKQASAR